MLRGAVAAAALLALGATLAAPRARAAQITFTITGSTQMFTLGQLLTTKYASTRSDLQIGVNPTSSQTGFDDTCTYGASQVGMSDSYILDSQLREQPNGASCADMTGIPVAISATPAIYNLPGKYFDQRDPVDHFTPVHPVKLTAQVIAAIYKGQVKTWNNPAIAGLNRGMKLPSHRIIVYCTSEPGGAGYVFNQWLAQSVPSWNATVGQAGLQPQWPPAATCLPSQSTMVQQVKATPYSFGFAGYDYAISVRVQTASLRNASGFFVTPSLNGLAAAIGQAIKDGFPRDFRKPFVVVKDPNSSQHAFNPASFEFFMVHKKLAVHGLPTPAAQAIKAFLTWAIADNGGQAYIQLLDFRQVGKPITIGDIPIPKELRVTIQQTVADLDATTAS